MSLRDIIIKKIMGQRSGVRGGLSPQPSPHSTDDITLHDGEVIDLAAEPQHRASLPSPRGEQSVFIEYNDDLTLLDGEVTDLIGKELPDMPVRKQTRGDAPVQEPPVFIEYNDDLTLHDGEVIDLEGKELPSPPDLRQSRGEAPGKETPVFIEHSDNLTPHDGEIIDLAGKELPDPPRETLIFIEHSDDLTLHDGEVIDLEGKELPSPPRETLIFIEYNDDLTLHDGEIIDLEGKELPDMPVRSLPGGEAPLQQSPVSVEHGDDLTLHDGEAIDLTGKELPNPSPPQKPSAFIESAFIEYNDDLTLHDGEIIDLEGKELPDPSPPREPSAFIESAFIEYNDDLTLHDGEVTDLEGKKLPDPSPPQKSSAFIESAFIESAFIEYNDDLTLHDGEVTDLETESQHKAVPVLRQEMPVFTEPPSAHVSDRNKRAFEIPSDFNDELSLPYSEIGDLSEKKSGVAERSDFREADFLIAEDRENRDLAYGDSPLSEDSPADCPCDMPAEQTRFTVSHFTVSEVLGFAGSPQPTNYCIRGNDAQTTDIIVKTSESPGSRFSVLTSHASHISSDEIVELTDVATGLLSAGPDDDEDTVNDFEGKDGPLPEPEDQIIEMIDIISEFTEFSGKNEEDTLPENRGNGTGDEISVCFNGDFNKQKRGEREHEHEGCRGSKASGFKIRRSEDGSEPIPDGSACFRLEADIPIDSSDNNEDTYLDALREAQASHIEELLDDMIFGDESEGMPPLHGPDAGDDKDMPMLSSSFYDEYESLARSLMSRPYLPGSRARGRKKHIGQKVFSFSDSDAEPDDDAEPDASEDDEDTFRSEDTGPVSETDSGSDIEADAGNPLLENDLLDLLKIDLNQPEDIESEAEDILNNASGRFPIPGAAPDISPFEEGLTEAPMKKKFRLDAVLERTATKMLEHIERVVMDERIISEAIEKAVRNRQGKKLRIEN